MTLKMPELVFRQWGREQEHGVDGHGNDDRQKTARFNPEIRFSREIGRTAGKGRRTGP